jgi:hypothetical protein
LGALLAACSTSTGTGFTGTGLRPESSSFPNPPTTGPKSSSFPNALTTGPAAGGYTDLNPVTVPYNGVTIRDSGNPPWVEEQPDGSLLVKAQDFTGSGGADAVMIDVNTTRKITFLGCKFTYPVDGEILIIDSAPEWRIEYCELRGGDATTGRCHSCVGTGGASNGTVDHCNMYYWEQAVGFMGGSNFTLTNSYIHDPGFIDLDHTECCYVMNDVNKVLVAGCTLYNGQTQTACLYKGGPTDNTVYTGNLLAGGIYTIYGGTDKNPNVTNLMIRDNWFSTFYYPNCGYAGTSLYMPNWGVDGNEWANNRWWDGSHKGQLVHPYNW